MKCTTCFRRFLRPSSGAQNWIYSIGYFVKPLLLPATVVAGSSKGFTKYPMLYIQFWTPDDGRRNRQKHVEHFTEINKLCDVASCWLYLKIRLRCTDPWTSNMTLCRLEFLCGWIIWYSDRCYRPVASYCCMASPSISYPPLSRTGYRSIVTFSLGVFKLQSVYGQWRRSSEPQVN